jgi:hypothetical protein
MKPQLNFNVREQAFLNPEMGFLSFLEHLH